MLFQEIINKVFQAQDNLPGADAHEDLSPYPRASAKKIKISGKEAKLGAVMVLLYPIDYEPYFVLIQRPVYEGTHSGQISFPGGKVEEKESLRTTALRETQEEIGIDKDNVNVIGELTEVYIPPSNFLVSPFIGYLDTRPSFIPDSREVEQVLEIPVSQLMDDSLLKRKKIKVTNYSPNPFYIDVPYFELNYETVWGATALILNELKTILKE